MSGRDKGGYTEGDGDEDEGGPQALPGGGGKLEPVEKHVAHPRLIEGRVTHGGLCADILVKDGHGDHGLRGVQHVVHHDEEVAVHSLEGGREMTVMIIWGGSLKVEVECCY